jgi:hypothetical protein
VPLVGTPCGASAFVPPALVVLAPPALGLAVPPALVVRALDSTLRGTRVRGLGAPLAPSLIVIEKPWAETLPPCTSAAVLVFPFRPRAPALVSRLGGGRSARSSMGAEITK